MNINKSLFNVSNSMTAITRMTETMERLQQQLATGDKASSLSELGRDRVFDLNIRNRLSRLDSYQASITTVNLRLDYLDNSLTRLDELEADSRAAVSSTGVGPDGINMVSAQSLAQARLDEVLTILGGDLNGRYMFGGSRTEDNPVTSYKQIMEGVGARAGFETVADQRNMADLGADGKGRLVTDVADLTSAVAGDTVTLTEADDVAHPYRAQLTNIATTSGAINVASNAGPPVEVSAQFTGAPAAGDTVTIEVTQPDGTVENRVMTAVAGAPANPGEFQIGGSVNATAANFDAALQEMIPSDTVTLAEDAVHDFGLKLSSVSTTSGAVSVSAPAGAPQMSSVRLTDLPAEGETVTVKFAMPGGDFEEITLKAVAGTPNSGDEFVIGADVETTLQNLEASLSSELQRVGETTLTAASVYQAADDFFNGTGEVPRRVEGPDYYNATTMIDASETDTMFWYTGEDSATSPRETIRTRVDENTNAKYGVQANETGIVDLVRSLAALSTQSYGNSDANDAARYEAMATEQHQRLSEVNNNQEGSLEVIGLELGVARTTVGSAGERHKAYNVQLETMLTDIESAPIDEVALQLLSLQTRLQASYQTTGIVSQLSMVNFMR